MKNIPVNESDARDALIYKDGILDYDAHDSLLRARGYSYLAAPCECGGTDDDGHLPCCGWGKPAPLNLGRKYIGDELAIFWDSPFTGKREKIASFWWPEHAPEETHEAERLFERIADRMIAASELQSTVTA